MTQVHRLYVFFHVLIIRYLYIKLNSLINLFIGHVSLISGDNRIVFLMKMIEENISTVERKMIKLATLNEKYSIFSEYQNHSISVVPYQFTMNTHQLFIHKIGNP